MGQLSTKFEFKLLAGAEPGDSVVTIPKSSGKHYSPLETRNLDSPVPELGVATGTATAVEGSFTRLPME